MTAKKAYPSHEWAFLDIEVRIKRPGDSPYDHPVKDSRPYIRGIVGSGGGARFIECRSERFIEGDKESWLAAVESFRRSIADIIVYEVFSEDAKKRIRPHELPSQ